MNWRYLREPVFLAESELIDLAELETWILQEDEHVMVVDKPGWVVCHPSKNGPCSSLVGACRERSGDAVLHLVSRVDRETSGLIVLAKHKKSARLFQMALQERRVEKVYIALLTGELAEPLWVTGPLARDMESPVYVKQTVRRSHSAVSARTYFDPIVSKNGFTLARVLPVTGRKHQIRAHAEHIGTPVVGDKVYGGDATLFLEFAEKGWTDRLSECLAMRRQALHAAKLVFTTDDKGEQAVYEYKAPLAWDMKEFCQHKMGIEAEEAEALYQEAVAKLMPEPYVPLQGGKSAARDNGEGAFEAAGEPEAAGESEV